MKTSTQIASALLLALLPASFTIQWGDKCAGALATLGNAPAIVAPAQPAPALSDAADNQTAEAAQPAETDQAAEEAAALAAAAEPVSNNFATDANGDLVTTKDALTRTRLPGGITLMTVTITTDKTALN